jgi:hypothetical protein
VRKGDDLTTFILQKVKKIRGLSLPEPLEPLRPFARQLYLLLLTRYIKHVWGRGVVHTGFWLGNLREGDRLEDPGVDEEILLKRILKKWNGDMDGIDLVRDRDRWPALVNTLMNLLFP